MRKIFAAFLIFCSLGIVAPAFADSLETARAAGSVGETANGYIAPVGSVDSATRNLIASVNNGRRAEYQKIAARNGQTLDVVENLAAKKIFSNLPAGTNVQDASGGWTKK